MHLFQESGRLASAERLINEAALDPRNDRTALLVLLVPMFRNLGCIDEAQSLVEDRWEHLNASGAGALEPAIKLVLEHIDLTLKAAPVATIRAFLDQALTCTRRRSRVARSSEPGDPNRRPRRGRALARCLRSFPSRRCFGLARQAELGPRD